MTVHETSPTWRYSGSVPSCAVLSITDRGLKRRLEPADDGNGRVFASQQERTLYGINEEPRLFHTEVRCCRDSPLEDLTSRDPGYGLGVATLSSGVAMLRGVAILIGVAI